MKSMFEVLKNDEVIVKGTAASGKAAERTAFALKNAFPDATVRYQTSPIQWVTAELQSFDDIL